MLTPWKESYDQPDSILKSRGITLSTKVCLVKAMVFPVVMYGCERWTIKKAECRRTDAFELWCWRRHLRVPWTARRSNQSIPKEISPECSLEGLMLKLKLQCFDLLRPWVPPARSIKACGNGLVAIAGQFPLPRQLWSRSRPGSAQHGPHPQKRPKCGNSLHPLNPLVFPRNFPETLFLLLQPLL